MNKYINYKRIKTVSINNKKELNIPYGKEFFSIGDFIFYDREEICTTDSQFFLDHFVLYDEWYKERLEIVPKIFSKLYKANRHKNSYLWNRVWKDEICLKYKKENVDRWFWSTDINIAPINDILHIAELLNISFNKTN